MSDAERIAIVGSRDFPGGWVHMDVLALPPGTIVRSGGAGGPDREAEQTARGRPDLPDPEIIRADWELLGKGAGKIRNWDVVRADRVRAYWDGWSNGTAHAVTAAVAMGVPVEVILTHAAKRLAGIS